MQAVTLDPDKPESEAVREGLDQPCRAGAASRPLKLVKLGAQYVWILCNTRC